MSGEAAGRLRLFLALDPPDDARRALAEWRERVLGGRDELRFPAPEALHVTIAFLGSREADHVDRIATVAFGAARQAIAEPPLLRAGGLRPLPPRRPRLYALELLDENERAQQLQLAVARALAAERLWRPERRPFWPHVTLARVRKGKLKAGGPASVGRSAAPLEGVRAPAGSHRGAPVSGQLRAMPALDLAFRARELVLYRSRLLPGGASYEPLARLELGASGGESPSDRAPTV